MFQEPWFWISFAGFFFNSNFYYFRSKGLLNGTKVKTQEFWASISMLGLLIFWGIGLFMADKWWQPLAAYGISMASGGLVGVLLDIITPRALSAFIAAASPFISFALVITSYIVWY